MQLKIESLTPDETYSKLDLESDLAQLLARLFITSKPDSNLEEKENALNKISLFVRMTQSRGIPSLYYFPSMIHQYLNQSSLQPMQELLIGLLDSSNYEVKLFALQAMLIMIFEHERIEPLPGFKDTLLSPLIQRIEDSHQTIRNWAACCLCYLTDTTFPNRPLLQQYTENLLEKDDAFWNKIIIIAYAKHHDSLTPAAFKKIEHMKKRGSLHAEDIRDIFIELLLNMGMPEKDQPISLETVERGLKFIVENDSDEGKISLKEQQLRLVAKLYEKNESGITAPIVDFVLNQFQIPELKVLAARISFIIIIKSKEVGPYLSAILDKLYPCVIHPEPDALKLILLTLKRTQFSDNKDNAVTALVKHFNFTLQQHQFDDAIKILLFLGTFEKERINYNGCVKYYLAHFGSMIAFQLAENKSLSTIHTLLITLLNHRHSDLRSFAAQAILIAVYQSYIMTFITHEFVYPSADLQNMFLPLLLEKLNEQSFEVRKWVACSLGFFDIGERADPQLLVRYTENLLETTNDAVVAKITILALFNLLYNNNDCFLSDTAITKITNIQLDLPACFRKIALSLFNVHVQNTSLPLPIDIIENCLYFAREADSNLDKLSIALELLKLIGRNFTQQGELLQLPPAIADCILNLFAAPETREGAWNSYAVLLTNANQKLRTQVLFPKLFSILSACVGKNDPEMHHFVIATLEKINGYPQEKEAILKIINTTQTVLTETEVLLKDEPNKIPEDKNSDTLLAELRELNSNSPEIYQLLSDQVLENTLTAVKEAYASDSLFVPAGLPIEEWEVVHCQAWAMAVKKDKTKACAKDFQAEMIAVVMRASVLDSGQTPRTIQLFTLFLLLAAETNGCLAEAKTGEGKTKIVSMFAAIKALQFDFVDVVSSSTILAKRDAHETENFFSILTLTVADNIDGHSHNSPGARPCYSANVVYGDTNEYQWDILREITGEKITRGGRPFRILFFDEVDSLLVDRSERSAGLSHPKPGLEYVNHMIVAVWHMMVRLAESIRVENNQWIYTSPDGNNEIKINNLKKFATELLKKYISNLVEDPQSPIFLPKNLKDFILSQADEFAEAAIHAYYSCHLNKHYVIRQDSEDENRMVITPVDLSLTGEIQQNSRWHYLHCYLELKHGLKIGQPQLLGNYLSIPGLCKRYANQIYGLTGTLGGADTQALFKEMYRVILAFIPPHKPKRFIEYEGIVASSKTDWLTRIITGVQEEVKCGRPVLVIAATISEVIFLEKELTKAKDCKKITRFSRNDTNEMETPSSALEPGDVIIATIIAGRGIDWHFAKDQSDFIEKQGGLHIIVSLLPLNLRVEQQIFGRTARKGNSGTAQLIINKAEIQHLFQEKDRANLDIKHIKQWRDGVESARVHKIKTQGIRLALLKDDLYIKFRDFLTMLKSEKNARHRINSIEEQWTYWLQNVAEKLENDFNADTTLPLIESKFEEFLETVRNDEEIIRKNTCIQVQQGNLLSCGTKDAKPDFTAAIAAYSKAIKDDPIVGIQAYYNRAETRILQKGKNYKDKVLADLKMAKTKLEENIIPQLQSMLVIHNLNPMTTNGLGNDFAKQMHCKIELLKMEIKNINHNINIISQARANAKKAKQKVDFEITSHKTLSDMFFNSETKPLSEIRELHASGLLHLFEVEPHFRKKRSNGLGAICVAFLGVVQIVVGVLVSYVMPMIGQALIQEGINDIMYAARALISGNFNWNAYLANKIGSVSITAISMGLQVLQNSNNLALAAEASKGQNALKGLATRQLNHAEVFELAKKEVVNRFIDTGAREVFNFAVDKLTTATIKGFTGDIESIVGKCLKKKCKDPRFQSTLDELLQMDVNNNNAAMQGTLVKMASKIIFEKSSVTTAIANSIIKGVLANQQAGLGTIIRIADMGLALDKILHFTDNFVRKFRSDLLFLYHQQNAQKPKIATDQNAITPLKKQFYSTITKRLAQNIIATAKGEIINPTIDMALHDHIQGISDFIKRTALQPVSPVITTTVPEIEGKTTPTQSRENTASFANDISAIEQSAKTPVFVAKPSSKTATRIPYSTATSECGRLLMKKRDEMRHEEITLFRKKLAPTVPSKLVTAPFKPISAITIKPAANPHEIAFGDLQQSHFQQWGKFLKFKSPAARLLLNLQAEFKSHDSAAQYCLDGLRMYPLIRLVEGLALVGDYSKENELHKKTIQSWGRKLKERDLFADESFQAATQLIFLEQLATSLDAVKKYTIAKSKERFDQLNALSFAIQFAKNLIEKAPVNTSIRNFIKENYEQQAPELSRLMLFTPSNRELNSMIPVSLYRGEERPPEVIFKEGFKAKGSNKDLLRHTALSTKDSAYISTSLSRNVAKTFPLLPTLGIDQTYVYKISSLKSPLNVDKELEHKPSAEQERAFLEKIKPHEIKGYWNNRVIWIIDVEATKQLLGNLDPKFGAINGYEYHLEPRFIPNPKYIDPLIPVKKIMYGSKILGYPLTALGAAADGLSLLNEYHISQKADDYSNTYSEVGRIGAGWAGAYAVGNLFAEMGLATCLPFSPLASAGCGIVGGIVGSAVGYMVGSDLVTETVIIYDINKDKEYRNRHQFFPSGDSYTHQEEKLRDPTLTLPF